MFDPVGIVLLLLALLALMLAVLVLVRGEATRRRILLAAFQTALAIYLIGAATMAGDAFTRFPHLARIGEPFLLLLPVLVFAYVKEFLGSGLQRADAFHLLPFGVYLGLNVPFYMLPAVDKIRVFDQMVSFELTSTGGVILLLVRLVVVGGYSVAAMRLAENWQGKARRVASDPAMLFSWVMSGMRQVMWALVIMTAMALLLSVGVISSIQYGWLSALTFGVAWLVFGWEAYLRMGQIAPSWILVSEKAPHVEAEAWPPIDDGDDVTCTPADEGFIWENPTRAVVAPLEMIQQHWYLLLEETMTKGEWWRDPSLTIYDLSEKVGLPAPLLARLIQDRERYTFFEYVNKLRVEAVKRQLTATRSNNVNFATLARDTGFTSRRMMNRVFSRLTGSSPKTYKRLAAVTMISKNYQ